MAHFIIFSVASVGNTRVIFLSADSAVRHPLPPPPVYTVHRLFTIQVLNKNEVRKWFKGYRSCRMATNSVEERVKE